MDIIAIRILVDFVTSVVLHIVNPKVIGPSPIIGGPLVQNNYHSSGMYPPTLRTCIIIVKSRFCGALASLPIYSTFVRKDLQTPPRKIASHRQINSTLI